MATRRPFGLLLLDVFELVLGRGLRQEIVHAGFDGDGRGGQRIVAGDHHRANAHGAQLREALLHAALDDVFQMDRRPARAAPSATASGVPPVREMRSDDFRSVPRELRRPAP